MKQKIFLTSVIAMGFVAPAMAEPSNTDTFPQDGLMQEDYTYTNAATSTNMAGVYEGTVNAVAQYEDVLYQIARGQYLPANSETPIDCDQNGYFCPGDNNGVYYSSSAQGLTQCPSGYGNSGTGASSDTECYRQCSGNVTIEHATGVTGNDYYGNGVDTCEPTGCENGWHTEASGTFIPRDDVPNLMNLIGASQQGVGFGCVSNNGQKSKNTIIYGLDENNDRGKFVVDFGNKGKVIGRSQCSSDSASQFWDYETNQLKGATFLSSLSNNVGANCWCKLDGYVTTSDELQSFSSQWIYLSAVDSGWCASQCAYNCANYIYSEYNDSGYLAFREALFYSLGERLNTCEANTITINWGDTDLADVTANEAGTATYGSDIRTPVKAQTKPGKTFTGWRFVAPEQASVQEP